MCLETCDEAVVDAVLTASRTLVALAGPSVNTAAEDTTWAQYRALVVLSSRGPLRMGDLARALEATAPTAGRMCDRLSRKGLIRRHRARTDRREVWVSITAEGLAVVDQPTARCRVLLAEILGHLTPEQQSAMAGALRAFAAAAQAGVAAKTGTAFAPIGETCLLPGAAISHMGWLRFPWPAVAWHPPRPALT
jgi:DNA-binding MarR family transcriptional regulator